MKTKLYIFIIGLFTLGSLFLLKHSRTATAQVQPQRSIVIFEEHVRNDNAKAVLESVGLDPVKELNLVNGIVVSLPDKAMVPFLETLNGVVRVEEDVKFHTLKPPGSCDPWPECKNGGSEEPTPTPTPSEDTESLEWGVNRIDADLTWSGSTGTGVNVAIIDTGIDKDHPDIMDNIVGGVNYVASGGGPPWARTANPNDWDDDNGHGTHVAGIVAAADNELGVIGVAPEANLYGVKVLDKNGSGYLSDVILGIEWSINNNMDVINMSLGSSSDSQSMHDAVDAAYSSGIVIVAAAGNSGDGNGNTNDVGYPAKYSSVIAVSATNESDGTPSWSSEGSEVEVAAPGVGVYSTYKEGGYYTASGTSMASPHAAGVVALMLSGANLTPDQVRSVLQSTADDLGTAGFDNFFGYGLVDAEEAVTGFQSNP